VTLVSLVAFWMLWFVVAAMASSLATSWLIGWAHAHGVLDQPNARSSHTRATPRAGGLAIVAVSSWAAILSALLYPAAWKSLTAVVGPALAIAWVSWLDDIKPLKNRVRFGVHVASAATAAAVLGPVGTIDLGTFGAVDLGAAAWPVTLLWIVGMTNAFNFMDGIDGIAGITAAAAGAAIAAAALLLGSPPLVGVALAFTGAAIGFLTCNWPPARIFMGDVGSAFCGFMIAVLPLAAPRADVARIVPLVALTMWPFIFDTAFTLVRRLLKGENIFAAHRSHLYQRLVIAGWSHRAVSTLYGGLSAMAATVALAPLLDPALLPTASTIAASTLLVGAVLLLTLVSISSHQSVQAEGRKPSGAS
jgi:UDP-N-acetylmuramyl pentapeptide phosphotransferase/UDP-N-acetylglucosamine-1-phosphate transferase